MPGWLVARSRAGERWVARRVTRAGVAGGVVWWPAGVCWPAAGDGRGLLGVVACGVWAAVVLVLRRVRWGSGRAAGCSGGLWGGGLLVVVELEGVAGEVHERPFALDGRESAAAE